MAMKIVSNICTIEQIFVHFVFSLFDNGFILEIIFELSLAGQYEFNCNVLLYTFNQYRIIIRTHKYTGEILRRIL